MVPLDRIVPLQKMTDFSACKFLRVLRTVVHRNKIWPGVWIQYGPGLVTSPDLGINCTPLGWR